MLYVGPEGRPIAMGEERLVPYPSGLRLDIDGSPYETVGRAIVELLPGRYKPRTWVAVVPVCSNGVKLQARLTAEEGIRGLKERAERARLEREH